MARENDVCGHLDEPYFAKGMCRACYSRVQYQANPEEYKTRAKAWQQNNPEKHREQTRRSYHKRKNMPTPTRPAPAECEICGKTCTRNTVLSLDHSHETGAFRGWLCNKCNTGLGKLGDNLTGLKRAVDYLTKTEGPLVVGSDFEEHW